MTNPEQPMLSSQEAYRQNYRQICDLMLSINNKLYVDAHDTEPKTWPQVDGQDQVIAILKDLAEFLRVADAQST